MRPGGKQRVVDRRISQDESSSSIAVASDPAPNDPGEELELDDGLDEEHEDDASPEQVEAQMHAVDCQLAAELHAQLNNLRPRRW